MSNPMTRQTRIALAACAALFLTGTALGLLWLSIYMTR